MAPIFLIPILAKGKNYNIDFYVLNKNGECNLKNDKFHNKVVVKLCKDRISNKIHEKNNKVALVGAS